MQVYIDIHTYIIFRHECKYTYIHTYIHTHTLAIDISNAFIKKIVIIIIIIIIVIIIIIIKREIAHYLYTLTLISQPSFLFSLERITNRVDKERDREIERDNFNINSPSPLPPPHTQK